MLELLFYKALFETTENRADFLSSYFPGSGRRIWTRRRACPHRSPLIGLKEHAETVSAFYVSNVEYYRDQQQQRAFHANVLALPADSSSVCLRFISGTGSLMP